MRKIKILLTSVVFAIGQLIHPSAFADQSVTLEGAVINTVGGIVIPNSGCAPALAITGIDSVTHHLLQLCTTDDGLSKATFSQNATKSNALSGQTYVFKGNIIGNGEVFAVTEVSGQVDEPGGNQKCTSDARLALAKKLRLSIDAVSYFDGAIVGDAADAIEVDMFQVAHHDGLYKVEMDGEMCDLRNIELVNN